jgi:hypothetical protein
MIDYDHNTNERKKWLNDKDMYSDDYRNDDDEDGSLVLGALTASVLLALLLIAALWFVLGMVDISYLLEG